MLAVLSRFQLLTSIETSCVQKFGVTHQNTCEKVSGIIQFLADKVFKELSHRNIPHLFGLFEKSQLFKFKFSNHVQYPNIVFIFVTLLVSKLLKSNFIRLLHAWNM